MRLIILHKVNLICTACLTGGGGQRGKRQNKELYCTPFFLTVRSYREKKMFWNILCCLCRF